jgi:hypothetical protein
VRIGPDFRLRDPELSGVGAKLIRSYRQCGNAEAGLAEGMVVEPTKVEGEDPRGARGWAGKAISVEIGGDFWLAEVD